MRQAWPALLTILAVGQDTAAHRILTCLQRLSEPLGTMIEIEDNIGVIRLSGSTSNGS